MSKMDNSQLLQEVSDLLVIFKADIYKLVNARYGIQEPVKMLVKTGAVLSALNGERKKSPEFSDATIKNINELNSYYQKIAKFVVMSNTPLLSEEISREIIQHCFLAWSTAINELTLRLPKDGARVEFDLNMLIYRLKEFYLLYNNLAMKLTSSTAMAEKAKLYSVTHSVKEELYTYIHEFIADTQKICDTSFSESKDIRELSRLMRRLHSYTSSVLRQPHLHDEEKQAYQKATAFSVRLGERITYLVSTSRQAMAADMAVLQEELKREPLPKILHRVITLYKQYVVIIEETRGVTSIISKIEHLERDLYGIVKFCDSIIPAFLYNPKSRRLLDNPVVDEEGKSYSASEYKKPKSDFFPIKNHFLKQLLEMFNNKDGIDAFLSRNPTLVQRILALKNPVIVSNGQTCEAEQIQAMIGPYGLRSMLTCPITQKALQLFPDSTQPALKLSVPNHAVAAALVVLQPYIKQSQPKLSSATSSIWSNGQSALRINPLDPECSMNLLR